MARLVLAEGASYRTLGGAVLNAANVELAVKNGANPALKVVAEDEIRAQIDSSFWDMLAFHYDGEATINIVVPYLGSTGEALGDPSSKLGAIAAEAIGNIVIQGCTN